MKGSEAEDRALEHLKSAGHEVLARNFRVRGGELDLVTRDGETIVFTEVKQRRTETYGAAIEMVNARQAARLRRTATLYLLKTFGHEDVACRFDLVAIQGTPSAGELVHLPDVLAT